MLSSVLQDGSNVLTLILYGAHSLATEREKASIAPLEAEYAGISGQSPMPAQDEKLTIEPPRSFRDYYLNNVMRYQNISAK